VEHVPFVCCEASVNVFVTLEATGRLKSPMTHIMRFLNAGALEAINCRICNVTDRPLVNVTPKILIIHCRDILYEDQMHWQHRR